MKFKHRENATMHNFEIWSGELSNYIDEVHVKSVKDRAIGCYGGCSESGANKNEDAYLILSSKNEWKFITLLDAHSTNESALFLLRVQRY